MTIPHNPTRRHLLAITARVAGLTAGLAVTPAHAGFVENLISWIGGKKGRGKDPGGGKGSGGGGDGARCFVRGTQILTANGEVAIEELRPGDLIQTVDGKPAEVRWIGKQVFDLRETDALRRTRFDLDSARPVRIAKHAIDGATPSRDLYVTPNHALWIDGFLMPAHELVNGVSITQVGTSFDPEVTYYNVLLDKHEVIFAEGLAVESLLADSVEQIESFANGAEYADTFAAREVQMTRRAPLLRYRGVSHIAALARRSCSMISDVRDPLQIAYDRIAARCRALAA